MKKIITIFLIAFCLQNSFAQSYQILNTAVGSLVKFTGLIDENDELYGYVELRKLDDVSKTEIKYRYSILDKNMNAIVTGDFNGYKLFANRFVENYQIKYNNGHILDGIHAMFDLSQNVFNSNGWGGRGTTGSRSI